MYFRNRERETPGASALGSSLKVRWTLTFVCSKRLIKFIYHTIKPPQREPYLTTSNVAFLFLLNITESETLCKEKPLCGVVTVVHDSFFTGECPKQSPCFPQLVRLFFVLLTLPIAKTKGFLVRRSLRIATVLTYMRLTRSPQALTGAC